MAKNTSMQEVEVLRFFETGPIEKVEAVFNIVCEKMRERVRDSDNTDQAERSPGASKQRRRKTGTISSQSPPESDPAL